MSDYQRFVSYLYEYQNNTKTRNCGFSRVEVRDHICHVEVHLKLPAYPFTPTLRVYVFVPAEGKLYGIFLGNATYMQGNVYGNFSFSDRNIQKTPYHFFDLGGILIQTNTDQCFGSAWKNITILPKQFVFSPNIPTENSIPNPTSTMESDEPKTADIRSGSAYTTETESPAQTETDTKPQIDIQSEEEIQQQLSPEQENQPKQEILSEQESLSEQEISSEQESLSEQEIPSDTIDVKKAAAANKPDNFWESILKSYPQKQPFFDDEIHSCVQLSPKDMHKLNTSGYTIENNAFFRHGCQSYQHFLLGKKQWNDKSHYILAVPGIYNPREQYMAAMFGFPYFKAAQNPAFRSCRWGYWYRIIPEHWNDCKA